LKTKIAIAGAFVGAFILGAVVFGYVKPALSAPPNPRTQAVTAHRSVAPVAQPIYDQPRYAESAAPTPRPHRSWERQALIIAGSSGAGAGIGAVAGGEKGAAIGAVSGGAAGLVYDLATRNH
jgi:hypothetical protein